ncbi:MAG TPA: glycosyltransferase, partial [Burkholderiaceae bacterium]
MNDFYENEVQQRAFFDAMADAYARAASSLEVVEFIVLAGIGIELRFASEPLRQTLWPALRHLRQPGTAPRAVIRLWDKAGSGGIAAPPPPFDKRRFTDRGDIWGFDNRSFHLAFHYGEFSVNMFDRRAGQGYYWVDDAAHLPYWSAAAPLRSQLHWCMERAGRQLLHAAAVGTPAGAVLLTGRGGVGKSSTALTALQEGMAFAGDDYVVVGLEPEPTVFPLYGSAKLHHDQIDLYPALQPWLKNPHGAADEKAIFDIWAGFAENMPASMPIRAILVPEIAAGSQSEITADIGINEVRYAASFTTMEQLACAGMQTEQFIGQLCRRVPGWRLRLGADRKALVQVLRDGLAGPAPVAIAPAQLTGRAVTPISVVVPVYNRIHLVRGVIANVLEQNYPDLDLIVVDDGSTDGSAQVARSYPQARVFEQPNSGPAQARNR